MVRPIVECATSVWDPHTFISTIESIQREDWPDIVSMISLGSQV